MDDAVVRALGDDAAAAARRYPALRARRGPHLVDARLAPRRPSSGAAAAAGRRPARPRAHPGAPGRRARRASTTAPSAPSAPSRRVAVVGAGFGWRALARSASGFVPGVGWAVRGTVAYGATRAVGEAALVRAQAGHDLIEGAPIDKVRPVIDRVARAASAADASLGGEILLKKQILVSVDRAETRVAILEDGRAAECYIERRGHRSVVGHVWKGRVENVLAGMEAAFIEIGLEKNGFLHVDEVVALGVPKRKRQIADLLKRGDEVLVQATKDPMGTKGVRLTMQLSLAGRFVVYVPFGEGVGVSKRLSDDERTRLRSICNALPLETGGLIVRTAASGASAREIARDLAFLKRLWLTLQERGGLAKAPTLLYSEADISLRVIRDLLNTDVEEVLVDDEAQFERITGFLRRTSPEMADRVRHWTERRARCSRPTASRPRSRSTMERRVPLSSGGYLVIDDTEAMTVIDVNSGRNVGKGGSRLEDTITKTNLEAATEVVRQLRLRDIGGIIIIDFIDMDDERNRKAVKAALDAALAGDRTRTFVVDISPLGLVEMTRQNISDGPREIMTEVCPTCAGVGVIPSDETHAITIERHLRRTLAGRAADAVTVLVNPRIADGALGRGRRAPGRPRDRGGPQDHPPARLLDLAARRQGDRRQRPAQRRAPPEKEKATRGASARRRVSSRAAG